MYDDEEPWYGEIRALEKEIEELKSNLRDAIFDLTNTKINTDDSETIYYYVLETNHWKPKPIAKFWNESSAITYKNYLENSNLYYKKCGLSIQKGTHQSF